MYNTWYVGRVATFVPPRAKPLLSHLFRCIGQAYRPFTWDHTYPIVQVSRGIRLSSRRAIRT